jgi:hypothetical protein
MKNIIFILILLSIISCKKDDSINPSTNTQTYNYGKNRLIGYIKSYDYKNPNSNTNGGITVKVLGGNIIIDSTYTDSTGKFEFDSLNVGTYDLVACREGWGKYTIKSFFCSPGPNPCRMQFPYPIHKLVRKVYSTINSVELDSVNFGYLYFTFYINRDTRDNLGDVRPSITYPRSDFGGYYVSYNDEWQLIGYDRISVKMTKPYWLVGKTVKCDFILSGFENYILTDILFPFDRPQFLVEDCIHMKSGVMVSFR